MPLNRNQNQQWPKHLIDTKNSTLSQKKTTKPEALKSDLQNWLSDVTVDNDEILEKARVYFDGLLETEKTSEFSTRTAPKAKSASQTSNTST